MQLTVNHIFLECPIYCNARTKANINTTSLKDALGPRQEKNHNKFHQDGRSHNEHIRQRINDATL